MRDHVVAVLVLVGEHPHDVSAVFIDEFHAMLAM